MNKILVTGATGFIGRYVVTSLLKRGYKVYASSATEARLLDMPWKSQVNYIPLDFSNIKEEVNYFDYFESPDLLIHLAWQGLPNYKEDFHISKNLPVHQKFLSNLIYNGLKKVSVAGTCLEYGSLEGELFEEMEVRPSVPYAIAKNRLRIWLEEFCLKEKVDFHWIRLFYMYGDGQNPKSLITQLERAIKNGDTNFPMSGGEQIRDYLPINQVAEYIVDISTQSRVQGIVNCCSGNPVKLKEFVEQYLSKKNVNLQLKFGVFPYSDYEPMSFWGNNQKLKSIIANG